jgi:hypothetical protein
VREVSAEGNNRMRKTSAIKQAAEGEKGVYCSF